METLQNETYYEMENLTLVAQGELTGDYKIVWTNFSLNHILIEDEDGQYIIKKQ
jgi:hypothetical protein